MPDFAAFAHTPVSGDAAVETGVLPNGLRYAVMHSDRTKGAISVRLGIDVGSFEESESERGVAHFLEHMAFRSTKTFPGNTVDGAFAAGGVAFGRDQNAVTELFSTRFEMNLPGTAPAALPRALAWLRDVADGIVFDPASVETERGVVLAEREARDSAQRPAREALEAFLEPGLRAASRSPIGTDQVLRSLTAEQLQSFYRRWYRPDNAIVVMVGDLPLETMKAEIARTFGSWRSEGPKPARAAYQSPDPHRGLDTFTRSDAGALTTTVQACRVGPASQEPRDDFQAVRRMALSRIWRDVLDQRLEQAKLKADNQILNAEVSAWTDERNLEGVCLFVQPAGSSWAPALAAAQAEVQRFESSGPTDLEVEHATDRVRAHLRSDVHESPNRSADQLADAILDSALSGRVLPNPRQQLRAFDLAVEGISTADVRAAFARDWSGGGPFVSVIGPDAPAATAVRTAWLSKAGEAPLAAYADRTDAIWGYDLKPAGTVASRQAVASGKFVRIRFRNGVILNFKQTAFSQSKVSLIVRFGEGRQQIAPQDLWVVVVGGTAAPLGGLGKHSYEDVARMARVDAGSLALRVGPRTFSIGSDVLVPNLDDTLKVVAAYLLDPGFRPTLDPILHEAAEVTYRLNSSTPGMAASTALTSAVAPGSPLGLPSKATMLAMDSGRLAAVLKPILTTGPLEVTLVGDIDEQTAVRLVANSFGALPPRAPAPAARSDAYFLRYPAASLPPVRAEHTGPADKAIGEMVWPLYVATPERRREELALNVLAEIFSNELRREVRGELGKAYAPMVITQMPDYGDQGSLVAVLDGHPADLDALVATARKVSKRLTDGAITEEQLEAARAPMLAEQRRRMETNFLWAAALANSASDDQAVRDIMGYEALVASLRLDEIRKAAADWLTRDPFVVTATAAPAPATTGRQP